MVRLLVFLVAGFAVFGGYNFMYANALRSVEADNTRRYETVRLSPAEIRAKRRASERRKAKLEKVALKPYDAVDKKTAIKRIRNGCRFLVAGFGGRRDTGDLCGCVAKGMNSRLNAKQVNFVYASAKHGGLRMLAGRKTSSERLRITYKVSRNSAKAIERRVTKIVARCAK